MTFHRNWCEASAWPNSPLRWRLGLPIGLAFLPALTPLAAIGLVLLPVLAIPFHLRRNEYSIMPFNLVLLALVLFVAWGRWDLLAL